MNYADGQSVEIGDKVHLGGNRNGVVVGIIDNGEYADGYAEKDWKYLKNGLVINTDFGDLRMNEPDEDLFLLARLEKEYEFSM